MTPRRAATAEDFFADAERLLEEAWGATVGAANGLLLVRNGHKPETTARTRVERNSQRSRDPAIESLLLRYVSRETFLHGQCFYDGICGPLTEIERRIRETREFLDDTPLLSDKR